MTATDLMKLDARMAGQLRVEREEGWYHVGSHGIERHDIFRDDRDRLHWLDLLAEAQEMFRPVPLER